MTIVDPPPAGPFTLSPPDHRSADDPTSPPPPPPPCATHQPSAPLRRPPSPGLYVAMALGAVAANIALSTTAAGLGWTLGPTLVAVAVAVGARPTNRAAYVLLALVPVFSMWSTVRASSWLFAANTAASAACLVAAVALAHRGRVFDQSLVRWATVPLEVVESTVLAMPWLGDHRRKAREQRATSWGPTEDRDWAAVRRGLFVAAPLVLVLGALLSSADLVFREMVNVGPDVGDGMRHLLFGAIGAFAALALLSHAARAEETSFSQPRGRSATTTNVVLAAVAATLGLYAVGRIVALGGMDERIASTEGLTWAEYARSGFFQLLAVAAITLAVLLTVLGWVDDGCPRQQRSRRWLGVVTAGLIVLVVVDAIGRLAGYSDAYGMTMLRLASTAGAVWIGVAMLLVGAAFVGGYRRRRWLTSALVGSALATLLVVNVMNPEATVARHNLARDPDALEVDAWYLTWALGDDAVPAIEDNLHRLPVERRREVMGAVCDRPSGGFWESNVARRAADGVRREWCNAG